MLTKISIENNGIQNSGLKAIAQALKECRLIQEFYLYNNELDDDPIEDFTKLLSR